MHRVDQIGPIELGRQRGELFLEHRRISSFYHSFETFELRNDRRKNSRYERILGLNKREKVWVLGKYGLAQVQLLLCERGGDSCELVDSDPF